jgi:hypothetical protein
MTVDEQITELIRTGSGKMIVESIVRSWFFIPGVEWPVVTLTDDGLLYPRLKPRRADGFQR